MDRMNQFVISLSGFVASLSIALACGVTAKGQDTALTAYENSASKSFATNNCVNIGSSIPAGKRLVIERISMRIRVNKNEPLFRIELSTGLKNGGGGATTFFPPPTLMYRHPTGIDWYVLNHSTRLYADTGYALEVCRDSNKPPAPAADVFVSVVGYFVDVP